MEDKRIEELLHESWRPESPDGMRERVLRRAHDELEKRRFEIPWIGLPRWQAGFVVAGLAIWLACGISDSAREHRLASLEMSDTPVARMMVAQQAVTLVEGRAEVLMLLENGSPDSLVP